MYCSLSAEVQFDLKITLRVFCKSVMKNYQMVRFLTVTRLSLYSLKHFLKIHQFVIKQELLNRIYICLNLICFSSTSTLTSWRDKGESFKQGFSQQKSDLSSFISQTVEMFQSPTLELRLWTPPESFENFCRLLTH